MGKKKTQKKNKSKNKKQQQPTAHVQSEQVVPGEEVLPPQEELETLSDGDVENVDPTPNTSSAVDESKPHEKSSVVEQYHDVPQSEPVKQQEVCEILHPSEELKARLKAKRDSKLLQVKHPLNNIWTLWYFKGVKGKTWEENLLNVCDVGSVEDMWRLMNHLIKPSRLSQAKDLSYFKKGIRPEWEDKANQRGGLWSLSPRHQRSHEVDNAWAEVLMMLVGNQNEKLSAIMNGATFSKRRTQDRISLWINADYDKQKSEILEIGELMKKAVSYAMNSFRLDYSTSDDWRTKSSCSPQVRFTISGPRN